MDNEKYRQKIIELITKCDNAHWLEAIYAYVKTLLRKAGD